MKAFLFLVIACVAPLKADTREALAYMNEVSAPSSRIAADMWAYIKSAAHSKNPAETEARRTTLIRSVEQSILQVNQVRAYKDETRFRGSILKFLNTMYSMLKEDYARIVDMEEVAEQSYDLMEAYILARKKASEKLNQAADELRIEEKRFASENNITLIEQESEISRNLKKAGEVMNYHNQVYLIFFRSYKQEIYMIDAAQKRDINKIEQNRATLLKYSEEGLTALRSLASYSGDSSLIDSCRAALEFYRKEASEDTVILTEFLLKNEQFAEFKKAFDLKPQADRTQADVDAYNKRVNEVNALAQKQNSMNQASNQARGAVIDRWNKSSEAFFSRHVPR